MEISRRGVLADGGNAYTLEQHVRWHGFAEPRDNSLPLAVEDYLSKPVEAFAGMKRFDVNDRNTAVLARFYRGLEIGTVVPRKD